MAEKITLKFDKPIQIFEINGMDYEVYYDDKAIERYRDTLLKFSKEYDEIKVKDIANMPSDKQEEIKLKQTKLIEEFIESIFGKDSYEVIYVSTGKSMLNLLDIVEAFSNWLNDKLSKYKKEKQNYYTRGKKR